MKEEFHVRKERKPYTHILFWMKQNPVPIYPVTLRLWSVVNTSQTFTFNDTSKYFPCSRSRYLNLPIHVSDRGRNDRNS